MKPKSARSTLPAMTFWASVLVPLMIFVPGLSQLLTYACFIGLLLVFRKPHWRRLKYDIALTGIWAVTSYLATMEGGHAAFVAASVAAVVCGAPLWIPILSWLAHRVFIGPANRPTPPERLARTGYVITHFAFGSVGAVVGLSLMGNAPQLTALVLIIMAITRYFAAERLAQAPVVYLRKFMSGDVKDTFHALIRPAISPRRVLVGLTRASDHKSLVTRRFGLTPARLFVTPDASWQDWVLRELHGARCAVIDLSDISSQLLWELDQARALLPPEDVALLVSAAALPPDAGRSTVVTYDGTRRGRRQSIRALRLWLDECERRRHALT